MQQSKPLLEFHLYIQHLHKKKNIPPLFGKEKEYAREKRVTPGFGGYRKRNFIPPNSGCYKSNPLNRNLALEIQEEASKKMRLVHRSFIASSNPTLTPLT
jgi:hypothetical protein